MRIFNTLQAGIIVGLALSLIPPAVATSVRPPEFRELVENADAIVRGEVTQVRSQWRGESETRRIVTIVTFRVDRLLVGHAPPMLELELLGGQIGDERWVVGGMPVFTVGDRDILFVKNNGAQVCPLVGFSHGRYLLVDDPAGHSDATIISRNDGVPLESVDEVALPLMSSGIASLQRSLKRAPLRVAQFEQAILDQAQSLGRVDRDQPEAR